jgi:uncharacterized protein with FMN-binding domain
MENQAQTPSTPSTEPKQSMPMKPAMLVIALIAIASVAVVAFETTTKKTAEQAPAASTNPATSSQPAAVSSPTSSTTPGVTAGDFKDGTYTVVGNYTSPGGPETIGVKLTLKDNLVTAVEVTPNATLPTSKNFQNLVAENVGALVVGKNISEIKLDKVSGSSLTPKGFNDALEKVKAQAKS